MLRALEAGRDAGGDKRCPLGWPAYSAILLIEGAGDRNSPGDTDTLRIVTPKEIGLAEGMYRGLILYEPDENSIEPLKHLRQRFEREGGQRCQL